MSLQQKLPKRAPDRRHKKRRPPAEVFPLVDPKLIADAESFIDNEPQLQQISDDMSNDTSRFVAGAAELVAKVTRKQHIKALMFAYALWLKSGKNLYCQNFVEKLRAQQKTNNKKTTTLHLLVKSIVSYGDEKVDQRRLHSRDVAAINYLYFHKIGPAQGEDLFQAPGQGLDRWSKDWAALKGAAETGESTRSESIGASTIVTLDYFNDLGDRLIEAYRLEDCESTVNIVKEIQSKIVELGSISQQIKSKIIPKHEK